MTYSCDNGKDPRLCPVDGCQKKCRSTPRSLCSTHSMKLWRMGNRERDAYANLRSSAMKRGHAFTLSFDQFLKEIEGTDYLSAKGRKAECLHMDRVDVTKGYEAGNLQVLTCSANVVKGNKERVSVIHECSL